jgi:hypothetical protein
MDEPNLSHPDSLLIDKLGGTAEVARICQIRPPSVSGWRTHGIPQARRQFLALLRPDVFAPEAQFEQDRDNHPGAVRHGPAVHGAESESLHVAHHAASEAARA